MHPGIRITLPANPQNVVLVRQVVAVAAEELALSRRLSEDLALAVTEACTNVVRHAYAGAPGKLEVEVRPRDGALTIEVADEGVGLRASDTSDDEFGLPLMAALAGELTVERPAGRGSRVRMSFETDRFAA